MIVRIVMHPIHMHLLHFSSGLDHCGVGGLIAAQALFDGFSPHSKNASREWLEGKSKYMVGSPVE